MREPTNQWELWAGLTQETVMRLRSVVAFLVMMVMLVAGLIVIRLATRSWQRVDRRLRERSKRRPGTGEPGEPPASVWEAAGERLTGADAKDPDDEAMDDDEDEEDDGHGEAPDETDKGPHGRGPRNPRPPRDGGDPDR
ncbi:MAG: hypothetical protein NTW19_20380 [Planctomycetota bacterium]|nr:hypothetical protein [Planctomycetota bacterium]